MTAFTLCTLFQWQPLHCAHYSNNSHYTVHTIPMTATTLCTLFQWQPLHCAHYSNNSHYTVHTIPMTAFTLCTRPASASQDSSQHIKCWKQYAGIYGLAFLKMGIMVLETCWTKCWLINHNCCIKLVSQIISHLANPTQWQQVWRLFQFPIATWSC